MADRRAEGVSRIDELRAFLQHRRWVVRKKTHQLLAVGGHHVRTSQ